MKILGIDYGGKRVGLALSDESCRFAIPLEVVENNKDLLTQIKSVVDKNMVNVVVMGESRNYKGEANTILADSLTLKQRLEELGLVVYLEPEFMTSVQAERLQGKNDLSDASAAALILQSYLDKQPSNASGMTADPDA